MVLPFTAALILPGAEEHELPLRMIETVLRQNGWTTYYLGKNIPISSLESFFRENRIDVLGLSVTMSSHINSCEVLIRAIKAMDPEIRPRIMVGGSGIADENTAFNQLEADFYFKSQHGLIESVGELKRSLQNN